MVSAVTRCRLPSSARGRGIVVVVPSRLVGMLLFRTPNWGSCPSLMFIIWIARLQLMIICSKVIQDQFMWCFALKDA